MPDFVLKAAIPDPGAAALAFADQKTMYGGKGVAVGDTVYLVASEHAGGAGLVARGRVTAVAPTPRLAGVARQTPRVSLQVAVTARAARRLGRAELRPFMAWGDGRAETELNFKLYRQATDKLVGVSPAAAGFLAACFDPPCGGGA